MACLRTSFLSYTICLKVSWIFSKMLVVLRVSAFFVMLRSSMEVLERTDLIEASISDSSSLNNPDWRENLRQKPIGMMLRKIQVLIKPNFAVIFAKDTTNLKNDNLNLSSDAMLTQSKMVMNRVKVMKCSLK